MTTCVCRRILHCHINNWNTGEVSMVIKVTGVFLDK